jgi:hypothetical protein
MIFCGQCGYQLAPGETRCPRCGSLVESNLDAAPTVQDYHPDDPTVASRSLNTRQPSPAAASQQKLVLRPTDPDYSTQPGNEETTRAVMPAPGTVAPPTPPDAQTSYPGHTPQGTYYTGPAPQSSPIYPPQDASYPAYGPGQPTDYAGQYQPPRRRSTVGRTIALILILLGMLLIVGAMVLFVLRTRGITGNTNQNNGSSTVTATTTVPATATPSAASASALPQALAVIQQYYNDINHHSYRAAYNLWKNNPQGFLAFRNGFKNTVRDQVMLGSATVQADGTVKIPVTVNATETVQSGTGTRHVTYQGYYVVGQQADGSWQILSGYLSPV